MHANQKSITLTTEEYLERLRAKKGSKMLNDSEGSGVLVQKIKTVVAVPNGDSEQIII